MWYISLVALLALCHSACASWTDNLKADIRCAYTQSCPCMCDAGTVCKAVSYMVKHIPKRSQTANMPALCVQGWGWCLAGFRVQSSQISNIRVRTTHVMRRSVHIVPTLQLLKDVPQQPGPLYQTIELTDKSTYKLRVRTPSQEWWSPQFWSASLQSVVVKGRRCVRQPSVSC